MSKIYSYKVRQPKDTERIKYFPPYSEMNKYQVFSSIDISLVVSIVRESFSLVTRESLASKKPVIISECGGAEEVIRDGFNGFIVKINDADSLLEKVDDIIEDPCVLNHIIENINTRDLVFIDEQVNDLENMYIRVVNNVL